MKDLFLELNKKNEINQEYFDFHIEDYLSFLENTKYNDRFISIYNHIYINNYIEKYSILEDIQLENIKKCKILSLFIFKSINKSAIRKSSNNINFLTSDLILNDIVENLFKFNIFYVKKGIYKESLLELRKNIFKIIKILILEDLIISKNQNNGIKTIEYWSFGFEDIIISDNSTLLINLNPFKLVHLDDNFYLIGDIFYMVQKIFIENKKSNFTFILNDIKYIEKMINNKIYLNKGDLDDVIKLLENNNINKDFIEKFIEKKNDEFKKNSKIIDKNKNEIKKYVYNYINIELKELINNEFEKDFIKLKEKMLYIFKIYLLNFLEKINIEVYNIELFYEILYDEFIKNFNNAKVIIKTNNQKEMEDFKEMILDIGVDEKKIKRIIPNLNKNENKYITKLEIDSEKISFLKYLMIYSKKEVDEMIKKTCKRFKNNEKELKNKINLNEIEKNEDIDINLQNILWFTIKYTKIKDIDNIRNKWSEHYKFKEANRKIISDISKNKHFHELFILKEYCDKNLKKFEDKHKNILIYFMFYFDFRGRFYYNSSISPTNNRFSRLFFNYGILKLKENHCILPENIKNNMIYIDIIKKLFEINDNRNSINIYIYWTLISLGKINIDKSRKEIKIEDFLKNSILNINKEKQKIDLLEIAEINLYIKILKNLKDEEVIRRCLLKDATASFFQNLVRILGTKNDNILKMSNLNSKDTWYDWYAHNLEVFFDEYNIENDIKKYFTRKTIKKVIMTIPYSATFSTCLEYFKNSLEENLNYKMDKNDNVYKTFKDFYKFQEKYMNNQDIFIEAISDLKKRFKIILEKGEKIEITHRNNNGINLSYFKTKTKKFDLIINYKGNKRRIVKNYTVLLDDIDPNKTLTALNANLVHCVDALLIQDINTKINIEFGFFLISIHDCFMVDFTIINEFIDIVNIEINNEILLNNKINKDIIFNSPFIFI